MENLTPRAIVAELDKYVIGQAEAKRALAVALRNRYRRAQLPERLRDDVSPKNILLIGPTGVGKTELARRLAKLVDAPFVKVEATKFTEAGYVGRDVESIVQDLVEAGIHLVHERRLNEVTAKAEGLATDRLVTYVCRQLDRKAPKRRARPAAAAASAAVSAVAGAPVAPAADADASAAFQLAGVGSLAADPSEPSPRQRRRVTAMLAKRELEDLVVEIEVEAEVEHVGTVLEFGAGMSATEMTESFNELVQTFSATPRKRSRAVAVRDARRILMREEAQKLIDYEDLLEEAVRRVEESGVVFVDELDKIAGPKVEIGADVSGAGVQRDLLPIVEGSTVTTRFGPVKTDFVLFVAAGSFYQAKPSDLIPELQGRFPLRVELSGLAESDLKRILLEPETSLLKQYQALLGTEGVTLEFTPDAVDELARFTALLNQRTENIGARRLHTVVERVLSELSFEATERSGERVVVDGAYVRDRLTGVVADEDLSRYIL
ncbi:MAG: ATP-dependent protease ATPase subunit HslU [Chloroflexi bacterium]|nr:ATP-dependent protease ATPase subunit HslU [Chloroflexota bacterium]